jgi:cyclohexyl-isocyanide hydratase
MPARMDLVAAMRDPVRSDLGVGIVPTATFDEIEPGLDILCVPGGAQGGLAAMADPATIAFVARQGAAARWVTSVCTGSLVLGAAGLLRGDQATTHWLVRDVLPMLAQPV